MAVRKVNKFGRSFLPGVSLDEDLRSSIIDRIISERRRSSNGLYSKEFHNICKRITYFYQNSEICLLSPHLECFCKSSDFFAFVEVRRFLLFGRFLRSDTGSSVLDSLDSFLADNDGLSKENACTVMFFCFETISFIWKLKYMGKRSTSISSSFTVSLRDAAEVDFDKCGTSLKSRFLKSWKSLFNNSSSVTKNSVVLFEE